MELSVFMSSVGKSRDSTIPYLWICSSNRTYLLQLFTNLAHFSTSFRHLLPQSAISKGNIIIKIQQIYSSMDIENEFEDHNASGGSRNPEQITTPPNLFNIDEPLISETIREGEEFSSKVKYYNSLKKSNSEMTNQIKSLNAILEQEVRNIEKKMYANSQGPKKKPRVKIERSPLLEEKYAELDSLKKQLEGKIMQKRALKGLEEKAEELRAQYRIKFLEEEQKQRQIQKLTRMLKEKEEQESIIVKNTSIVIGHELDNEARELKQKIKKQTNRVNHEKEEFISKNKRARKINQSVVHMAEGPAEVLSNTALQLKAQYELIGKRIEALKVQKQSFSRSIDVSEKKKQLQILKGKYAQICKL